MAFCCVHERLCPSAQQCPVDVWIGAFILSGERTLHWPAACLFARVPDVVGEVLWQSWLRSASQKTQVSMSTYLQHDTYIAQEFGTQIEEATWFVSLERLHSCDIIRDELQMLGTSLTEALGTNFTGSSTQKSLSHWYSPEKLPSVTRGLWLAQ